MGMAKRMMIEREEHLQWATGLLIKTDAAYECEVHGYIIDSLAGDGPLEEAIALARANPPPGVSPDEAEQLVRDAVDDLGMECPGCSKD